MERSLIKNNENIRDFYHEKLYRDLEEKEKEIVTKLKEIFEKNEKTFKLVQDNSIYNNIKLYTFSSRVKDKDSLFEKLFRNNIQIEFIDDEEKLKKEIKNKIGDLIGIKISTTLRCDCFNAYQLIEEKIKEIGMELLLKDDEKMPSKMKNGRKIYKVIVKCEDEIQFELQIKSNIDSSWSDIEHSLFYKDYDYTEVKTNNHEIMLNIGNVLDTLEETMKTIRSSRTIYTSEEREKYRLFERINEKFSKQFKELYKINFQLSSILPLILFLEKTTIEKEKFKEGYTDSDINLYEFFDNKNDKKEINLEKLIFEEIDTRITFHIFYNFYNDNNNRLTEFFSQWYSYMFELYKKDKNNQAISSESYIKECLCDIILNLFEDIEIERKNFLNKKILYSFFEKMGEVNKKIEEIMNGFNDEEIEELFNREGITLDIDTNTEIEEIKEKLIDQIRKDILKEYFLDKKEYTNKTINLKIDFK